LRQGIQPQRLFCLIICWDKLNGSVGSRNINQVEHSAGGTRRKRREKWGIKTN